MRYPIASSAASSTSSCARAAFFAAGPGKPMDLAAVSFIEAIAELLTWADQVGLVDNFALTRAAAYRNALDDSTTEDCLRPLLTRTAKELRLFVQAGQ